MRDLPRGDRDEGDEPSQDPPDCPVCEQQGNRGQPLTRWPLGRWWCRRHRGFVDDSEVHR